MRHRKHGTTIIGFPFQGGVVVAAESRESWTEVGPAYGIYKDSCGILFLI